MGASLMMSCQYFSSSFFILPRYVVEPPKEASSQNTKIANLKPAQTQNGGLETFIPRVPNPGSEAAEACSADVRQPAGEALSRLALGSGLGLRFRVEGAGLKLLKKGLDMRLYPEVLQGLLRRILGA